MNAIFKTLVTTLILLCSTNVIAQNKNQKLAIDTHYLFNERLTNEDKNRLENGGVVIRSVSSMKKLCMNQISETKPVIQPMSEVIKSGYIAEIINIRSYKGNEDLIERINEAMSDFLSYTDIQYYSEYNNAYFPLYTYAEITSSKETEDKKTIVELLEMDLFGRFHSQIDVENYGSYFLYKLKNIDKLKFHGIIPVVKQEGMQSVVAVFRSGDNWIIYAVGGANVLRVPIVNMRAEPAFIGRVKAFADFVFSKIDGTEVDSSVNKDDASKD